MAEQIMVGMPICLSLPTLSGFSSSGPRIGSKPAVNKENKPEEKLSSLPHIKE